MLTRIGFRPVGRIDPFDGGPHYECRTDEILLVRQHRRLPVAEGEPGRGAQERLVGASGAGRVRFRAVRTPASLDREAIRLPRQARRMLRVAPGDPVDAIPLA
jgi:arginine N-succinyltransferase